MSMPQPRRETWHLIWSQTWKKNQMKKSNMEIVIIITLMSQLRLLSLNPNQTMSTKSGKEGWTLKSNNDSFKLSKLPSNIIEIWQQCSVYTWAYVSKSGLYLKFYHQYEFVFLNLNMKETDKGLADKTFLHQNSWKNFLCLWSCVKVLLNCFSLKKNICEVFCKCCNCVQ